MTIEIIYLVFSLLAVAAFRYLPPAVATLVVYLGGWIVLPVGHYPTGSSNVDFPYWITGLAVPSDLLLSKSWIAPVSALIGVVVFDRQAVLKLLPAWMDAPIALWCVFPLLQSVAGENQAPSSWISCLYLLGCWGAPWLLGRLYFSGQNGAMLMVKGLVVSALACLPFSVIEGVIGPQVYGWVYETHPFRFDGDARYLGYRPIGFFEHGNQFGLWISLCALAAVWFALCDASHRNARRYRWAAVVVVAMALAAQSVGGILLLVLGSGFLWASRFLRPRAVLVAALTLLILGGATYVSGSLPIDKLGRDTTIGRHVVDAFKSVGRGSFTWRIAQDQRLLRAATQHPVLGSGHWDWWRAEGSRPWGLALLLVGQFGVVGLGLAFGALLVPAAVAAWRAPRASAWRIEGLPLLLATIVALTAVDALMNSFIFFPALMIAGALAGMSTLVADAPPAEARRSSRPRGEVTRIARRV
jgi:hypothetical protein